MRFIPEDIKHPMRARDRSDLLQAKSDLEGAIKKYQENSKHRWPHPVDIKPNPEDIMAVIRCKAKYLRVAKKYQHDYNESSFESSTYRVLPGPRRFVREEVIDQDLLKKAEILDGFFLENFPEAPDALQLSEHGSATEAIMTGDGSPGNPFRVPEFKDNSGKIRRPRFDESVRVMAHVIFHKFYSKQIDQCLKSGEPIPVKMREGFSLFLADMLELHGITPDTHAASEGMFSEIFILCKQRADELLKQSLEQHFVAVNGVMPAVVPAGGHILSAPADIPKRTRMLTALGMDPAVRQPKLADFQERVLATAENPTKWQEFLTNSGLTAGQGKSLFALAQNTRRAHKDVIQRQKWVDSTATVRDGKEGKEVIKQADFYKALLGWNKLMRAAQPEDKTLMVSAVTSVAVSEAFSAAPRGEVKAATVGDTIHDKIISAYGTAATVSADVKHTATVAKAAAETTITLGNQAITQHADDLKKSAAISLATCRAILNQDLNPIAAHMGGAFPAVGNPAPAAVAADAIATAVGTTILNAMGAVFGPISTAIQSAAREAVIAAATNPPLNATLQDPNPVISGPAKAQVALRGSVAAAVAAAVFNTDSPAMLGLPAGAPQRLTAIMEAIAADAAAAAPHGKAAVTQAIRVRLLAMKQAEIHGFAVAGAPSAAQIEQVTQRIMESAGIALAVQKGEIAAQAVRVGAEAKAANAMAQHIPKTLAVKLSHRLYGLVAVDDAAVTAQLGHAINDVNTEINQILSRLNIVFIDGGQLAAVRNPAGEFPVDLDDLIKRKITDSYLKGDFSPAIIANIIYTTVQGYNHGRVPQQQVTMPEMANCLTAATNIVTGAVLLFVLAAAEYHVAAPQAEVLTKVSDVAVKAYKVSGEAAEAAAIAAAKEAGVSDAEAKAAGAAAKVAIEDGKDGSGVAVAKLPVSGDLSAAAAVAVLVKNGNSDAVAEAANNGAAVQAAVISAHSHDRVAAAANIAAVTAAAIADANLEIAAPPDVRIPDADIATISGQVEALYRQQDGVITEADVRGTARIAALRLANAAGHVAALDKVEKAVVTAAKIQKGIEAGKEAELVTDAKGTPMASAIASVAGGLGISKVATMAIAREISKHYVDNKETIDDKAAREKIKSAVDLLNTKAEAIAQAALATAPLPAVNGGLVLGVVQAGLVSEAIRNHYLVTGSLTETDVTRLVHANYGGALPPAVTQAVIKTFYDQVKRAETSTVVSNPTVPAPVWYTRLSIPQENALAKMAVAFSDKTDPAAAGSAVAAAAVQLSGDLIEADAVAALAVRGLSKRPGATLDLADVGNGMIASHIGMRAAAAHIEKLGAAAAVAAAGGAVVQVNFLALNHAAIAAAAQAAYQNTDVVNGVRPGTVPERAARDAAVTAAVTAAAQAAFTQAPIVANTPIATPVNAPAVATVPPALPDLPRGVPYDIPAASSKTVAQSVGVAGATVAAAMKAGFSNADAQAIAIAVARPEIVAGGPYAVSKKLRAEVQRLNPSLPASMLRELTTAACGGLAVGEGMARVSNPLGTDLTRGQKLVTLIKETAMAAGSTEEAASAAAEKAKARMTNSGANGPLVIDVVVNGDARRVEVQAIAALAATSLREANFGEAAFAVSTAVAHELTNVPVQKALAASTAAGTSQVTDAERQLAARSAEEQAKKVRAGQLHTEASLLAQQQQVFAAKAAEKEAEGQPPESELVDMSHYLSKDCVLDAAKADSWTVTYEEDGRPVTVNLGDDEFKECAKALKECCDAEGNSYVTEATVKQAVMEFNKTVGAGQRIRLPEDITDNGKGGIRLSFKSLAPGQVKELLLLVAKKSKLTMTPATVNASRLSLGG